MDKISQFLSTAPILKNIDGYKKWIGVGLSIIIAGSSQLGYIDPGVADKLLVWVGIFFGAAVAHSMAKADAVASDTMNAVASTGVSE